MLSGGNMYGAGAPGDRGGLVTGEQHGQVYQIIRKSRGINWTLEEKMYLVQLCATRCRIIEEKKSDLFTLRKKAASWKAIHDRFSGRFGRKRTPLRIKEQWKRMKIAARAEQRDSEIMAVSTGIGNTNLQTATRYYGECSEIIDQVQKILNQVQRSEKGTEPRVTGESLVPDILTDATVGIPGDRTSKPTLDNRQTDPKEVVIKIEIDDDDDSEGIPDTEPERMTSVVDFNGFDDFTSIQVSNVQSIQPQSSDHAHTSTSGHSHQRPPDVTPVQFSNAMTSNCHTTAPEVSRSVYDNEPTLDSRVEIRKTNSRSRQSDYLQECMDTSSSVVDDMILEYAQIEHEKKMEYIEKEHRAKMEILAIEREAANAKLRKANFKLTLVGANVSQ